MQKLLKTYSVQKSNKTSVLATKLDLAMANENASYCDDIFHQQSAIFSQPKP